VRYGQRLNADKNNAQQSLFGGENALEIPKPKVSECEPYGPTEKLNIEKEVVGVYISGHPLDQFKFEMQYFCNSKISDLKELDGKIGHDMTVAGIVTDAAHKMTKNGKPFGILTLEDYEEHHTFYIFSDDYIKFKEFISPGWFLYLKGKVMQKLWGDQKLEYKIQDIQILGDIREKMSKGLSLYVQPNHISNDMIDRLESLAETYPGNCKLKLNLRDEGEQMEVQLLSRKYMIQPHDDLLKELEMISGVNFMVET
jgi:DNA polymerase-3 subunit alpha